MKINNNNIRYNKGQAILGTFSIFALVGSVLTGAGFIYNIKSDVKVIEERENNHYKELKDDNKEMKSDIKDLLKALNVNSTYGK